MKITNRLYISALISIALIVVFASVRLVTSSQIAEKDRKYQLADNMRLAISELHVITSRYLMDREKQTEQQWNLKYHTTARNVGEELAVSIRADYAVLGDLFSQVTTNYRRIQRLTQEGASQEEIDTVLGLEENLVAELLLQSESITTDASRLAKETRDETVEIQQVSDNIMLFLMIVLVATAVITSVLVVRSIAKPLTRLLEGTQMIAKGSFQHKIGIKRKDEMGQLATSFNEMTGRLQESYNDLKEEVTKRKAAAQEIRELNRDLEQRLLQLSTANKELEGFSYYVSHDLRVPLRAIICFSEIFLEDHGENLDKEGRRVLNVVRDNAQRTGELIDDLLTFSHQGRKEIIKKSINMEKMAKDIFEELKVLDPEPKPKIKVNTLPFAYGDESLMHEVLINLLSNAIKFSKNEKRSIIEVGGRLEEDENIYYIKDNGVGFDMKYSDKLFGVFQRLHSQEEFKGTGIGLALVQRIIHRHGGRVWAEGKPDKGATFYFTLPLRKRKETKKENEK